MYVKYGTYQHPPGEANIVSFSIRQRRSARGFQLANIVEAHVSGEICAAAGETQYNINTKLLALDNALVLDGQDFGLYHDNGTATHHVLYTADPYNLTGNQIVHRSYPHKHNGEFSTGLDFSYAVRAEFAAFTSVILDYNETISHQGTTDPKVEWHEHRYLAPYYSVESLASLQTITQSGYAVTLDTYLTPPSPIMSAPYELRHLRTITRRGPRRYPQGVEGYRIEWTYHFRTPSIFAAVPSVI